MLSRDCGGGRVLKTTAYTWAVTGGCVVMMSDIFCCTAKRGNGRKIRQCFGWLKRHLHGMGAFGLLDHHTGRQARKCFALCEVYGGLEF